MSLLAVFRSWGYYGFDRYFVLFRGIITSLYHSFPTGTTAGQQRISQKNEDFFWQDTGCCGQGRGQVQKPEPTRTRHVHRYSGFRLFAQILWQNVRRWAVPFSLRRNRWTQIFFARSFLIKISILIRKWYQRENTFCLMPRESRRSLFSEFPYSRHTAAHSATHLTVNEMGESNRRHVWFPFLCCPQVA